MSLYISGTIRCTLTSSHLGQHGCLTQLGVLVRLEIETNLIANLLIGVHVISRVRFIPNVDNGTRVGHDGAGAGSGAGAGDLSGGELDLLGELVGGSCPH